MAEHAAKEPTMEEILASIRQIISEGNEPGKTANRPEAHQSATEDLSEDGSYDDDFDLSELLGEDAQAESEEGHLLSVDELLGADDLDYSDLEDLDETGDKSPAKETLSEDAHPEPQVELDDVFNDADDFDELLGEVEAIAAETAPVYEAYTRPPSEPEPKANMTQPQARMTSSALVSQSASQEPVAGGHTIEGMVSALMQPIIKEWIDANLPTIVERRVEAEINQIAGKVIAALRE